MDGKRKSTNSVTEKSSTKKARQQQSAPSTHRSKQLTRETFMRSIKDIEMYTDKDDYYQKAKINVGPLELDWS